MTVDQMQASVRSSIGYLERHTAQSGKFTYVYDPWKIGRSSKYNLLRHAGTTMVMFQAIGAGFGDELLSDTASRAWSYLTGYLRPLQNGDSEEWALAEEDITAKLGGTALTLLGLVAKIQASESPQSDDLILAGSLARYIIRQQRRDGSFRSVVNLIDGTEYPFSSVYYPGEAILALCSAFRITQDHRLLNHAVLGARFLIGHSLARPQPDGFTDHWLMMSLAALDELVPDPLWKAHLSRLSSPLLSAAANEDRDSQQPHWLSCGLTAPMATRLEGLLASLSARKRACEWNEADILGRVISRGLKQCSINQVIAGHHFSGDASAIGGFIHSPFNPRIRIDYVQHALGAFIGALSLLTPEANGSVQSLSRYGSMMPGHSANSKVELSIPSLCLEMSWNDERQTIRAANLSLSHEGPALTNPTHDLAHLLLAANGNLPWHSAGDDRTIRLAQYNATVLDYILDQIFSCLTLCNLDLNAALTRIWTYSGWFVNEHFAPFPVSAEEAFRRFCENINPSTIARLSPYFFALKQEERDLGALRKNGYNLSFMATDCPAAEGQSAQFRTLIEELLLVLQHSTQPGIPMPNLIGGAVCH